MGDRARYDSAMFWLAFGTAAAVIGLALMTIGITRTPSGANVLSSPWFDGGVVLLVLGGVLLLWALGLYLARRRAVPLDTGPSSAAAKRADAGDMLTEAVRGYYAERDRLFKTWEKRQGGGGSKSKR